MTQRRRARQSGGGNRIDGQIVLVTGASSGLGLVTARELAARGAKILLVCRDETRGQAALEIVRAAATGKAPTLLLADLSQQAAIRRLAREVRRRWQHLDVLVNNAGGFFFRRELTVDGVESTFAVNHLAPFLLTNLLLDRLDAAPAARVVTVSSVAHRYASLDFDNLQGEARYDVFSAYARSKLANALFTLELARRLDGTQVTANCLHPGVVATNLGSNNGWLARIALWAATPFLSTPEQGAQTTIYLASSADVAGVSGAYFADCREEEPAAAARDTRAARRLWKASEKLTADKSGI
jgi:retinol dehydrogenase 12